MGTSKNTYNLVGYFEDDSFNARVAYTYRSAFFGGLDRADRVHQDDIGNLAASLGYKINDWMSLSLDALNLNNPKLKYYAATGPAALRSTRTAASTTSTCASSSERAVDRGHGWPRILPEPGPGSTCRARFFCGQPSAWHPAFLHGDRR